MISVDLTISLTTAERNALSSARPKLKAHLTKAMRLYRKASAEQRLLIRQHCPIFDALLDIFEGA